MVDTPTKVVVDCTTGETQIIPLTAEEIAQREVDAAAFAAAQAEREEAEAVKAALKASAKAKLIAGTPLTEEEAAVLVIQFYHREVRQVLETGGYYANTRNTCLSVLGEAFWII